MTLTVFCEGADNGPDIRLIEAARFALEGESELAQETEVRAAGSRGDLNPLLRLEHRFGDVRALRDRDFSPRGVVDAQRAKPHRSFPLSRHCIESYLLDTGLISGIAGIPSDEYESLRDAAAAERLWMDVHRGVIEQFCARHRLHPARGTEQVRDRAAATAAVETSLNAFLARIETRMDSFDVAHEVEAMRLDMQRDGPLWSRVDGKKLLRDIHGRLNRKGMRLGKQQRFEQALLTRAELDPPAALVDDVRALLETI